MAVDLRGQADATIASAAARAGAALAGPDYSTSFQNIATGYQLGMQKLGAGLAAVSQVGAAAATDLVEKVKEAKTTYTESGAWGSVMGNFKGLLKEGFDIFKAERGEDRDVQKQEFKDKWNTSVGSLKSMIDKTFMVEMVLEEGEYNKAYLEENPDKAAQFSIIRSTKKNPVDAPGLPYDGCYSDMEVEDGAWVKKYYGPDGAPISSFGPDGTPIYVDKRDMRPDASQIVEDKTQILREPSGEYKATGEGKVGFNNEVINETLMNPLKEGSLDRLAKEGYTIYVPGKDGIPTDEIKYQSKGPGAIGSAQIMLNRMGYTGVDGKPLKVDNLLYKYDKDGKRIKSNTEHAFEQFKKDQEAREQGAGDLFSSIQTYADEERTQMSVNGNDISKLIVRKNPETQAGIQELQLAAMESGSVGLDFKSNEYRNAMKDIVDDKDKFSDMAYTPIGNEEYSFAQLLTQPNKMTKEMFNQVVSMGKNLAGIDPGEDGIIDENDFQEEDAANLAILRKEMLNYSNPQAREIFFDYLVDEGASRHKEQLDIYNRKLNAGNITDDGGDGLITSKKNVTLFTVKGEDGTTYVRESDMNNNATAFHQIETGDYASDSFTGWNGETYSFENDQWYVDDVDDGGDPMKKPIPRQEVIDQLKFSSQPTIMDYLGTSLEGQDIGFMEGSNDIFFQSQTGKGAANMGDRDNWKKDDNGYWQFKQEDGSYKTMIWKNNKGQWIGTKIKGMPELAASKKLAEFLEGSIDNTYAD